MEPGANIARGRNVALAAATHDVIAVTDADCILEPTWLAEIIAPIEAGADVSMGFYEAQVDGFLQACMASVNLPLDASEVDPATFNPSARSVAYRRDAIETVGGYPEWLAIGEDMWVDLGGASGPSTCGSRPTPWCAGDPGLRSPRRGGSTSGTHAATRRPGCIRTATPCGSRPTADSRLRSVQAHVAEAARRRRRRGLCADDRAARVASVRGHARTGDGHHRGAGADRVHGHREDGRLRGGPGRPGSLDTLSPSAIKLDMTGKERERRFRAALSHRDYRLLLSSLAVSETGNWLYAAATIIYILDATGSAAWVGVAAVVRLSPYILFEPLGGAIADRYDRRKVMITADLARAVVMCVMALVATSTSHTAVAVVIALTFVNNTFTAPYYPAVTALTPSVVPERDLAAANALAGTIDNFALAFGPGLSAILLLLGPAPIAIALNGITFLVSAFLVARMHVSGKGGRGRHRTGPVVADGRGREGDPRFEPGHVVDRARVRVRPDVRPGSGAVRADR